jgi:hypothetical protein
MPRTKEIVMKARFSTTAKIIEHAVYAADIKIAARYSAGVISILEEPETRGVVVYGQPPDIMQLIGALAAEGHYVLETVGGA